MTAAGAVRSAARASAVTVRSARRSPPTSGRLARPPAAPATASARIAQVANFYSPQSGGLRTTVDMLGRGYTEAGFERVLVVPGPTLRDEWTSAGRRITLPAPILPGSGGYRVFANWRRVAAVLADLDIDRLEVSDKLTLWPLAAWATQRGVPSVLLSHERLDAILSPRLPSWVPLAQAADRGNRRLAAEFPTVVATSTFSCEEWQRIGARNLVKVPLGVDLATFRPEWPARGDRPAVAELICVGRLSREKRPDLAVGALGELLGAGVAARLTIVGTGPEAERLRAMAAGLPVRFTGHISDRRQVARLLAAADIAIAPCPVESFGLSVLEALACATPVVCCNQGAAQELLTTGCGASAPPRPAALAAAIASVLARRPAPVRSAARRQAEQFGWPATVAGMLAAHRLPIPKLLAEMTRCG